MRDPILKELSVWADAVIFSFGGNNWALLASWPEKYFIVLSADEEELWRRFLFFFAIRIGRIPLSQMKYCMGSNWEKIK